MPKNKGWFRLYDRMIDSPQVLELDDSEFRLLISLWCLASAENDHGKIKFNSKTIFLRVVLDKNFKKTNKNFKEIEKFLKHLIELDLLSSDENGYFIPRWDIHQYGYSSRIPGNRSDLLRKDNGKSTVNKRKTNGKVEPETETETEEKEIYKEKESIKNEHSPDDQCPDRHSIRDDQCSKSKKTKVKKVKYAEFVSLTNDEYLSLVAKLGSEDGANRCIEILDNYKGQNNKRYRSDYRAILNWVIDRLEEEERKKQRTLDDPERKKKKEIIEKLYLS